MPIKFTCPHCGATTEAADQYAGQSGPCAQCGKMVTVPLPGGMSPPTDAGRPVKQGMGTGPIIAIVLVVVLAVVLVCGGILAFVFLPVMGTARGPARRAQCTNNLKNIALAMHEYEARYKCFPPAFVPDKNGKPMHSWRVLLLPYLDRRDLYEEYRFNEPWDSPHNRTLASRMPRLYACPSDTSAGSEMTSYLMLVGPHAFSTGPKGRKISEIKGGLSNTIMVAEVADSHVNWMEPKDLDTDQMRFQINGNRAPNAKSTEISSGHPNGANVALGDGSVHFLNDTIDSKLLKMMTSVDQGGKGERLDF